MWLPSPCNYFLSIKKLVQKMVPDNYCADYYQCQYCNKKLKAEEEPYLDFTYAFCPDCNVCISPIIAAIRRLIKLDPYGIPDLSIYERFVLKTVKSSKLTASASVRNVLRLGSNLIQWKINKQYTLNNKSRFLNSLGITHNISDLTLTKLLNILTLGDPEYTAVSAVRAVFNTTKNTETLILPLDLIPGVPVGFAISANCGAVISLPSTLFYKNMFCGLSAIYNDFSGNDTINDYIFIVDNLELYLDIIRKSINQYNCIPKILLNRNLDHPTTDRSGVYNRNIKGLYRIYTCVLRRLPKVIWISQSTKVQWNISKSSLYFDLNDYKDTVNVFLYGKDYVNSKLVEFLLTAIDKAMPVSDIEKSKDMASYSDCISLINKSRQGDLEDFQFRL